MCFHKFSRELKRCNSRLNIAPISWPPLGAKSQADFLEKGRPDRQIRLVREDGSIVFHFVPAICKDVPFRVHDGLGNSVEGVMRFTVYSNIDIGTRIAQFVHQFNRTAIVHAELRGAVGISSGIQQLAPGRVSSHGNMISVPVGANVHLFVTKFSQSYAFGPLGNGTAQAELRGAVGISSGIL